MKLRRCPGCGRFIFPKKDTTYRARQVLGLMAAMGQGTKTYDATDCPGCGCQVILAERLPKAEEGPEHE